MKSITKLMLLSLLALVAFASCSESDDVSEYGDWAAKNSAYIDSIAVEAQINASGEWKRFLATGLDPEAEHTNDYYVYCKVKAAGDGVGNPKSNSEVWVNYQGKLINGDIFDATYTGELIPEYETPVEVNLADCVLGFSVAVQEMVKGDVWEVFIPSNLGYGINEQGGIRPSSTLIFTINLVDFIDAGEKK